MNSFGNSIKITFFGESHGDYVGIVIDGLSSGIPIDQTMIDYELTKRRPKSIYSTARAELDQYQILSGLYNGVTTGAALTFIIPNNNTKSEDYQELAAIPRPSHSDYTAHVKYQGYNDPRGGGMFSGRITVLFMIIGAIAKQILNQKGIEVASHILRIHNLVDKPFDSLNIDLEVAKDLQNLDFPLLDQSVEIPMREKILKAKNKKDSVGGIVETAIINLPAGIGEPLFSSIESQLAALLFSVPAVKGVEFGLGFEISKHYGSEVNDGYQIDASGKISTLSNNSGGISGGISNGMPIIIKTAIKPTPSIGKKQASVNLETHENVELEIKGRHDPAIVNRVVHVINAVIYYGILDLLVTSHQTDWMR
jgi:chorismate synthase